jgi:hypothetical protein
MRVGPASGHAGLDVVNTARPSVRGCLVGSNVGEQRAGDLDKIRRRWRALPVAMPGDRDVSVPCADG